jgi:hypothetical protein
VVFQGVDGFYGAGDFLSHDIKIKSIEGSKVTLIVCGISVSLSDNKFLLKLSVLTDSLCSSDSIFSQISINPLSRLRKMVLI